LAGWFPQTHLVTKTIGVLGDAAPPDPPGINRVALTPGPPARLHSARLLDLRTVFQPNWQIRFVEKFK